MRQETGQPVPLEKVAQPFREERQHLIERIARAQAKNFYYSFLLLSRQQRKAMCAIYAFMRYCDDLSDEPGASRAAENPSMARRSAS